jgi:putative hydrolase of the HAD superfamily
LRRIRGVIFDLGGTLVDWPDWDTAAEERWGQAHDFWRGLRQDADLPARSLFVRAMREAELAHWRRVEGEYWSGPAELLIREGFGRLGRAPGEADIPAVLDGYAQAVNGWAQVFPDSRSTLLALRRLGYRIGLLSNTWWAAAWHNADLAAHGLQGLLDAALYTSDMPHSKPDPSVFRAIASRLGVPPQACLMVGDRPVDDIQGALGVGMLAVFKTNGRPRPVPEGVRPTATIERLSELPPLLEALQAGIDPAARGI